MGRYDPVPKKRAITTKPWIMVTPGIGIFSRFPISKMTVLPSSAIFLHPVTVQDVPVIQEDFRNCVYLCWRYEYIKLCFLPSASLRTHALPPLCRPSLGKVVISNPTKAQKIRTKARPIFPRPRGASGVLRKQMKEQRESTTRADERGVSPVFGSREEGGVLATPVRYSAAYSASTTTRTTSAAEPFWM
jgi:hypothetical protein